MAVSGPLPSLGLWTPEAQVVGLHTLGPALKAAWGLAALGVGAQGRLGGAGERVSGDAWCLVWL